MAVIKEWNNTLVKDIDPEHLKIIRDGMDKMMENASMALYNRPPEPIIGKYKIMKYFKRLIIIVRLSAGSPFYCDQGHKKAPVRLEDRERVRAVRLCPWKKQL